MVWETILYALLTKQGTPSAVKRNGIHSSRFVSSSLIPPSRIKPKLPRTNLEIMCLKCLEERTGGHATAVMAAWRTTCGGTWQASRLWRGPSDKRSG